MTLYIAQTFVEESSISSEPESKIFVFDSIEKRNFFEKEWIKNKREKGYLEEGCYCFWNGNYKHWIEFEITELNAME